MVLSVLVGVIAGGGAIVFFVACQLVSHAALDRVAGYRPTAPMGEPPLLGETTRKLTPWLLLLVPTVGGLVSGWIVYSLAPEAEGHGTDADGHLLGVVLLEDIHLASQSPHIGSLVLAADLMRGDITPLRAADRLDRALEMFVENDQPELPLVDDGTLPRVIGIVKRSDISAIYLRYVHGATDDGRDYVV